jgi:hypothetical protein
LFSNNDESSAAVERADELRVRARTTGLYDDGYAAVVATWTIPHADFDQLGDAPSVSVLFDASTELVMSTGPNTGRSALYAFDIRGTSGVDEIGSGSSSARSIDSDEHLDELVDDTAGFGGRLPSDSTDAVVIELTVECSAFGGTTLLQIGEESSCDAEFRGIEMRVRFTRN